MMISSAKALLRTQAGAKRRGTVEPSRKTAASRWGAPPANGKPRETLGPLLSSIAESPGARHNQPGPGLRLDPQPAGPRLTFVLQPGATRLLSRRLVARLGRRAASCSINLGRRLF